MHQNHGKLACILKVLKDTQNYYILLNLKESLLSLRAERPKKFSDISLANRFQGPNISPFSM